jgi:branched-chain amino acid transport system permease protein
MTALLEVRGVIKRFSGLTALDGVDLSVGEGEIHGLIGPNGSGKTTLLNVIAGVYHADRGWVRLSGRDLTRLAPQRVCRAGIARTFQNLRLFRTLTVREHVQVAAAPDFDVDALLEHLGLARLAGQLATSLPYGLQRRVELARALASQPRLLLLDEPAAGLAGAEVEELRAVIRRLQAEGLTLLLIDHHMGLVMSTCTRLTALHHGRVICAGDPAAVARDPVLVEAYLGHAAGA